MIATSLLQDILVVRLTKANGGTKRRWRIVLGPVGIEEAVSENRCNWSLSPTGSARELEAVEKLVAEMQLAHPTAIEG